MPQINHSRDMSIFRIYLGLLDVGIRCTKNIVNYYTITKLNHALNLSSDQGRYNPKVLFMWNAYICVIVANRQFT